MDDLLAEFLTETSESLSELDLAVVRLERAPNDQPTLSLIFRLVHTIKGTCGFLGLPRLERVAHASETVLDRLRNGSLTVSTDGIGLILSAIDRIRLIVDTISRTEAEPDGDDLPLIAQLNALAEGKAPPPAARESTASIPLPTPTLALDTQSRPDAEPAPAAATPPAAIEHGNDGAATRGQTIRVSVEVLETLMTLVSELVLTRNQFLQQLRSSGDSELTGPVQRLSHLTTELQEGVMKTRMQPIGNVWNMLPRQVRDLAHDLGKRVDLVMHGAETELDRQVLELIKDPLTHMIRNSADHGLETPADRRRAGKPDVGTITLSARHEGGHVVIEIEDDGRGIDVRKIADKAVAQGLSTRAQVDAMSEEEIRRFIFAPGFSTAAAVTSVSGRGVGMDVVKTNIEQIGGMIELHSVLGRGSRFLIKIPLTLAIVSALIVGAAGERFAIPQASVVEVVLPTPESDTRIETIDGAAVLRLRDLLLPLIRLSTLLQLPDTAGVLPKTDMVAVIGVGSARLGLIVDGVFDTEEIVVKPVAHVLRHIPLFGGNTILEDGAVIMILDPTGIARHAGLDAARKETAPSRPADDQPESQRMDMLLVRAGAGAPKAMPLSLISRLESIAASRLEVSGSRVIVQYRNELMPIIPLDRTIDMAALATGGNDDTTSHPVLVFDNGGKPVGLLVETILDVVETDLNVEFGTEREGFLGTTVIADRATDIVDVAFWLTLASGSWFRTTTSRNARKHHLLVVDDSSFFRQLVAPSLSAAGYDVTVADSAEKALAMRDAGRRFDAIVSDIEMPGLGGIGFARTVREGGSWTQMPMLALTGSDRVQEARAAGFTDTIRKFERDTLLTSLEQCLLHPIAA